MIVLIIVDIKNKNFNVYILYIKSNFNFKLFIIYYNLVFFSIFRICVKYM